MTLLLAAVLGVVIGLVIGAFGGGGGVLTVPVLVYVLGQSAHDATTGSLIIVAATALTGTLARVRCGHVRWGTGIAFGAVGVPAAALGSVLSARAPEHVLLLGFAGLTLLAAVALLIEASGERRHDDVSAGGGIAVMAPPVTALAVRIVLAGALVGFLTGLLGVGGGFLAVPALIIGLRLPMTSAIGTSLLVITLNSVAGLATRAGSIDVDPAVVLPFAAAAVVGTLVGKRLTDKVSGPALATAFAVVIGLTGVFVGLEALL
ncbi:sulfite exporter TauE/SafE family protein [Pseudonocardia sp. TRM90224]|uniref:sulfite exporter TauE/SafE family protein n=1 Tax=Pseudonocardia sp. TRM90224 TaxID=2812678 RepID=UPI001E29A5E8|nr:sulfite exporter TauE/SafE family protein [Pseudonocardia sp. TRM90224]